MHCQEPNDAPWHTANHGLVRGVIRVTSVSQRDPVELALLSRIDHHGPMAASSSLVPMRDAVATEIVVEASSPGFDPVQVGDSDTMQRTRLSSSLIAYAHLPLPRSTILCLWSETPNEYAIVSCAVCTVRR